EGPGRRGGRAGPPVRPPCRRSVPSLSPLPSAEFRALRPPGSGGHGLRTHHRPARSAPDGRGGEPRGDEVPGKRHGGPGRVWRVPGPLGVTRYTPLRIRPATPPRVKNTPARTYAS